MPTANDEIRAFLNSSGTDDSRKLDVARLFARSMLRELRSAGAEWEATAATLDQEVQTEDHQPQGRVCKSWTPSDRRLYDPLQVRQVV